MAKSIRSKRKRKLRNVKRERNAKKELERLKGVIEKAKEKEDDINDIVTMKSAEDLMQDDNPVAAGDEDVEMDASKPKSKVNPKTLKNEHGNYPVWMNQRKVKKLKKKLKKISVQKKKLKRS